MSFYEQFMSPWQGLGMRAGARLNELARRPLQGEVIPPRPAERFDFSEPPPGHYRDLAHPGYVRQGHGRLRLLADAWTRWKAKRDPPGMDGAPDRAAAWAKYEEALRG